MLKHTILSVMLGIAVGFSPLTVDNSKILRWIVLLGGGYGVYFRQFCQKFRGYTS